METEVTVWFIVWISINILLATILVILLWVYSVLVLNNVRDTIISIVIVLEWPWSSSSNCSWWVPAKSLPGCFDFIQMFKIISIFTPYYFLLCTSILASRLHWFLLLILLLRLVHSLTALDLVALDSSRRSYCRFRFLIWRITVVNHWRSCNGCTLGSFLLLDTQFRAFSSL